MRELTMMCLVVCACGGKPAPEAEVVAAPPATKEAHDKGAHAHEAPHGGVMVAAGDFHIEAVTTKMGLVLYLYDGDEKPLPVDGVVGTVQVSHADGSPPVKANVSAMGNHLMTDVSVHGAWSAVASLTVQGKSVSARFEGAAAADVKGHGHDKGHEHGHEHGHDKGHEHGHEHGGEHGGEHDGHEMPAMELSKTIAGSVGSASPIVPGQAASLTFTYKAIDGGAPVADFVVTHERKLHVFIVSADLAYYDHVHPEPGAAEGSWVLSQTLPAPGKYRVYSDFKSASRGANVTVSDLDVPGEAQAARPLVVDEQATKAFGGMSITFAATPKPKAGAMTTLSYTLRDAAGAEVKDLEPYLGAMGHLFVLGEDLVTMAHSHPEGMERGPTVGFMTQFPKPGKYKLWAQFQRAGVIVTSDWVVAVE